MSSVQLPLIRKNGQMFFDVEKIKTRNFLNKILDLNEKDYIFETLGFCKDKNLFYIILNLYKGGKRKEETYEFSLKEFNDEYFISKMKKIKNKEEMFCEVMYL